MAKRCRSCCVAAPNTTVNGTIVQCHGTSLGATGTVTITKTSDGSPVWTGRTNASGVYTASFSQAGTVGLTFSATPDSPRLQPSTSTANITGGFSNTKNLQCGLTAGYHCCGTSLCALPLSNTLHISYRGGTPETATYTVQAGGAFWTSTNYTIRASDGMISVGGVTYESFTSVTCPPSTVSLTDPNFVVTE